MKKAWKLSPSDFAFLWEECPRCFYLKVVRDFQRPRTPMPKMFIKVDSLNKKYFAGRGTADVASTLPAGTIEFGDKWVESVPITVPGHDGSCYIRGKFDSAIHFENDTYGVIDFKTSESKDEHVALYSRQLHAYAYALEHAVSGKLALAPVSTLGLLCLDPVEMLDMSEAEYGYRVAPTWINCPRDDQSFLAFLGDVLDVLEEPEPPGGNPNCVWCIYRDVVRRLNL